MRRVCLTFLALVCLQMVFPQSADAWFGWLDELSGPGKFYGIQVDQRLSCFPKVDVNGLKPESVGVRLSFCNPEEDRERLFSIDLGERIFWARDHPSVDDLKVYADGRSIFLLTVVPAISYRPIYHLVKDRGDNWGYFDVVDVGAGAGGYWFSSKGFDDFRGLTSEVRVDFHLPPNLVTKLTRQNPAWYLVPQVRYARVAFPAGFEANAFGPALPDKFKNLNFVPDPAKDKSRKLEGPEWTGSWVFFIEARIGR